MKTVSLLPYAPQAERECSRELLRLLAEFATALRRQGITVLTPQSHWLRRFFHVLFPCRLSITLGFSHSGLANHPQFFSVIPVSPALEELQLARTFAATLAGTLNRGLRPGQVFSPGVLTEREFLPLLPRTGTRLAVLLGGDDSMQDGMAVRRQSPRLFAQLAQNVGFFFTSARA